MSAPPAEHSAPTFAALTAPEYLVFTSAREAVGYASRLCGTPAPTDPPGEMPELGPERIVLSPTARTRLRGDYLGRLLFNELAATADVRVSETAAHESSFAVTDDAVAVSTPLPETTVATTSEDTPTVERAREAAAQAFEAGEPYGLPGGTLSTFRERVAEEFDEDLQTDFISALQAPGETPDQQRAVLAAAANDCSLYAVSKLLEDCGLSSKATISRAKTTLEDAGAIATTQIKQDVGRPRQRLHLVGDDSLEDESDVAAVIDAVQ
ncbi:transcriptional regulator TbsP domain-containing protein [Halosegnis longus]|uniref:transcriptional regulator TbsP domain-containing protein n=1 Tax=Halosegnis longus TaxID=2216012 RepID=UPI00129DD754|nr:DUF5821 family protein [Halosegnis longus]